MIGFLKRYGIHAFLLPVFFVFHNYLIYFGLISLSTAIECFVYVLLTATLLFLLIFWLTKKQRKAAVITTAISFSWLFYGNIKDFIEADISAPFLSRYIILLPLLLIALILFTAWVLRKNNLYRLTFYLNVALFLFILIDVAQSVLKKNSLLNRNSLSDNVFADFQIPSAAKKYDVYYILLDCYPSGNFLRNNMHFDNNSFENYLTDSGFKIYNSRSNYNKTAFSMPSILNFDYLKINSESAISSIDYTNALYTTKESIVPKIFRKAGYSFRNLSIFDFTGAPSFFRGNFLALPEKTTLMYNSFSERFRKDVGWIFKRSKDKNPPINTEQLNLAAKQKNYNHTVIDSLLRLAASKVSHPKFIYAHLLMPHPPFFFTERGEEIPFTEALKYEHERDPGNFTSYLQYTNNILRKIIDAINKQTQGKAVIVLQSDHGYVNFDGAPLSTNYFFTNFTAIHFPGEENKLLPDTITNINTFPFIFNTVFKTNIPLKKDSTVILSYKKTLPAGKGL